MRIPTPVKAGIAALAAATTFGIATASAQTAPTDPYSGGAPQVEGRTITAAPAAPAALDDPALPRTGSDTMPLSIVAVGLIGVGAGVQVVARRRRANAQQ